MSKHAICKCVAPAGNIKYMIMPYIKCKLQICQTCNRHILLIMRDDINHHNYIILLYT